MVTVKDAADLAGVSTATVSRVLTDHPHVTDETRSKVLGAMEQLGYQPSRVARRLRMETTHTAIFTANDLMTLGALNAIHEKGLKIPRDVAIVGFDDMPLTPSLDPPLTAVAQPTYEPGCTAANLLLQRSADQDQEMQPETHLDVQGFMRSEREEGAEQGWESWRLTRLGPILFVSEGR